MKQLTRVLIDYIEKQLTNDSINIIRVEGIDNPIVYRDICRHFASHHSGKFVAKLTSEKFTQFMNMQMANWQSALVYLHQGLNTSYSTEHSELYSHNSFVDFDGAITSWRNESANFIGSIDSALVLLFGTELATDKGGLEDFCIVSPKEIISELKTNYSKWFAYVLTNNDIDTADNRAALNTFLKALYSNSNIDLFVLSNFIDEINEQPFNKLQELIDYICSTLKENWSIPNIIDSRYIPKATQLKTGKATSANVISSAFDFINRNEDIPTQGAESKIERQFAEYAREHSINEDLPYPSEQPVFSTYEDFKKCVLDFKCGKSISSNRERLLNVDYAVIADILGIKETTTSKSKTVALEGEPLDAFCRAFLVANTEYCLKYSSDAPKEYSISIKRITLSNCVDSDDPGEDTVEKVFSDICCFMGGMFGYFNKANIEVDGDTVVFRFDGAFIDPFDFEHYEDLKAEKIIRISTKWGDPCKLEFSVKAFGVSGEYTTNFKWSFSPYAAWNNAFSVLNAVINESGATFDLPTMISCANVAEYLNCESEDDFYVKLNQMNEKVLFDKHITQVRHFFGNTDVEKNFSVVCNNFKDWAVETTGHGIFNAFSELDKLVESYKKMMSQISDNISSFTDIQKENLFLFLNSFIITSNENVFDCGDVKEVIFPIYNPIMLERLAAKLQFILSGFKEIMDKQNAHPDTIIKYKDKMNRLVQLSTITQGTDTILSKNANYLTCKNTWGYFGVYYDKVLDEHLITSSSISNVITDDEESIAMLHHTPQSSIISRNALDYLSTFPARTDGLNIAFVAPSDMQHIVAAVHTIAKELESAGSKATINVKIICLDSKKNSASYLRRWLDSFFSDERLVKVNTFLRYMNSDSYNSVEELGNLLENHDLCFIYNILMPSIVQFAKVSDVVEVVDRDQSKFPMTFTPDAISLTHGKSRKINISQFQFLCSKYQTQTTHMAGFPNDVDGTYRAVRLVELCDFESKIIDKAHEHCKWVVCIDPSIDRYMLESNNNKIIGFTTGEGSYGELNVTVSARQDILKDIKEMLRVRITEKFRNWENTDRIQKAADYCIELTKNMDGSRILKALNPYDYEIHSFLAYVLTLQMLHISERDQSYLVRSLISLDSYKHWFESEEGNSRPDFMLIEIPNTSENLDATKPLKIKAKIIECKMGYENEAHLDKAREQLTKGIRQMSANWNNKDTGVMHRYWLNQLYRAIIFSPLNMKSNDPGFQTVQDKIFKILAGQYEIEWSGDIFAFWLDVNSLASSEYPINYDPSLDSSMEEQGLTLTSMTCHTAGQMFIQKMLLPQEYREDNFIYNDLESEATEEASETDASSVGSDSMGDGSSIPKNGEIYVPFLNYLSDGEDHSRQESLVWYASTFNIRSADKLLKYDNGHLRYETVLDFVITEFRKNDLLENTTLGKFHISRFGILVQNHISQEGIPGSFFTYVRETQEQQSMLNRIKVEAPNEANSVPIPSEESHENHPVNITTEDDTVTGSERCALKSVRFLLGEDLRTKEKYYWEFGNKELSNRHLLINGNSGCGKTYCIQALLMEAALQGISSVVFDYTGGFKGSKLEPLFKEKLSGRIQQRVVRKLKIPMNPFMKHEIFFDEDDDEPILEDDVSVAVKIANTFKTVYNFGDQQRSAIYSAVLSGLRKHGTNMSFFAMAEELENSDMSNAKTVLSKIRPFIDMDPYIIDDSFKWGDIRDSDGIVYVIQLDGYDRETQMLLTELLLWDIWGFCVNSGDESKPFIIVLDEAQNLSHELDSPSAKILTEGRKFGISGWYATQFMKPQLSDDEIQRLQQASQKLYFCPPDDGVLTVAKNIDINAQNAKDWAERLKKLKKGECVTCGNMTKNERWTKYEPKIIKITSLQERLSDGQFD